MKTTKGCTRPWVIIAHTTTDCPLPVPEIDSPGERTTELSFTELYGKQGSELKTKKEVWVSSIQFSLEGSMRHAIRSIFVKITLFVTEVSCLFVRAMVMRSLADREPLLRIQNTGFSLDPLKSFAELDSLNFPQTSLNLCPPILQAGGIPGLRLKRHCWVLFASGAALSKIGVPRMLSWASPYSSVHLWNHTYPYSSSPHLHCRGCGHSACTPHWQSLPLFTDTLGPSSSSSMLRSLSISGRNSLGLEDAEIQF